MRRAFAIFIIAALAVAAASNWAHAASPEDVARYFDGDYLARARRYRNYGLLLQAAGILITLLFLAFSVFHLGRVVAKLSERVTPNLFLKGLVFTAILVLLYYIALMPVWYLSYMRGKAYGFVTMGFGTAVKRHVLAMLVFMVPSVPLGAALLWSMRRWPGKWWIAAWLGFSIVSVIMVFLHPLVITPLFHKFRPIEKGPVREGVMRLAEKASIKIDDVLVTNASAYSTHTNAYFTGLGSSKRIVLYDTLIDPKRHTTREVLGVAAHEMGHWRHRHIAKGLVIMVISLFFGFLLLMLVYGRLAETRLVNFESPWDLRGLALIALLAFAGNFLATPVSNMISRAFERQADAFSLALTGDADAFISMQTGLVKHNLGDPDPPAALQWYFGTHPTGIERILAAEEFKMRTPGETHEK